MRLAEKAHAEVKRGSLGDDAVPEEPRLVVEEFRLDREAFEKVAIDGECPGRSVQFGDDAQGAPGAGFGQLVKEGGLVLQGRFSRDHLVREEGIGRDRLALPGGAGLEAERDRFFVGGGDEAEGFARGVFAGDGSPERGDQGRDLRGVDDAARGQSELDAVVAGGVVARRNIGEALDAARVAGRQPACCAREGHDLGGGDDEAVARFDAHSDEDAREYVGEGGPRGARVDAEEDGRSPRGRAPGGGAGRGCVRYGGVRCRGVALAQDEVAEGFGGQCRDHRVGGGNPRRKRIVGSRAGGPRGDFVAIGVGGEDLAPSRGRQDHRRCGRGHFLPRGQLLAVQGEYFGISDVDARCRVVYHGHCSLLPVARGESRAHFQYTTLRSRVSIKFRGRIAPARLN